MFRLGKLELHGTSRGTWTRLARWNDTRRNHWNLDWHYFLPRQIRSIPPNQNLGAIKTFKNLLRQRSFQRNVVYDLIHKCCPCQRRQFQWLGCDNSWGGAKVGVPPISRQSGTTRVCSTFFFLKTAFLNVWHLWTVNCWLREISCCNLFRWF